jgi:hypothetical protein
MTVKSGLVHPGSPAGQTSVSLPKRARYGHCVIIPGRTADSTAPDRLMKDRSMIRTCRARAGRSKRTSRRARHRETSGADSRRLFPELSNRHRLNAAASAVVRKRFVHGANMSGFGWRTILQRLTQRDELSPFACRTLTIASACRSFKRAFNIKPLPALFRRHKITLIGNYSWSTHQGSYCRHG